MARWTFGSLAALIVTFAALGVASAATDGNARRPHITIHPRRFEPGPRSKRHCESWLQKQYRVSGTVIVPQMRCWWD